LYCKVYICKLGKGKEKQSPLRPKKEEAHPILPRGKGKAEDCSEKNKIEL
jgi:hypothetical protein